LLPIKQTNNPEQIRQLFICQTDNQRLKQLQRPEKITLLWTKGSSPTKRQLIGAARGQTHTHTRMSRPSALSAVSIIFVIPMITQNAWKGRKGKNSHDSALAPHTVADRANKQLVQIIAHNQAKLSSPRRFLLNIN
jgi:hypothetical protein